MENTENKKRYQLTPEKILKARRAFEIREVLANLVNDSQEIPVEYIKEYNEIIGNQEVLEVVKEETEKLKEAYRKQLEELQTVKKGG